MGEGSKASWRVGEMDLSAPFMLRAISSGVIGSSCLPLKIAKITKLSSSIMLLLSRLGVVLLSNILKLNN
jgi:hypothetical protein